MKDFSAGGRSVSLYYEDRLQSWREDNEGVSLPDISGSDDFRMYQAVLATASWFAAGDGEMILSHSAITYSGMRSNRAGSS